MSTIKSARVTSRFWKVALACAAFAGSAAVLAPAEAAMHHGGPGGIDSAMLFMGSPQHVAAHVDHFLTGLNATDAQRTQITQIAQAAAADLKTERTAAKTLHQQSLQVFTAASIDPAAAESIRQQLQAERDQSSKRALQAMLDIGNVLTPDQRAQIGTRVAQRQAAMQQRVQQRQSTTTQ